MGLFKGMKDLKRLGEHHGGRPSIGGAFRDIAAIADDRGEGELLRSGTPAKAVATGLTEPVPGDRLAMQIPLEVHPPSGEPYRVSYVFSVARMKAGITAGMEIPIKIDPQNPERIAIQWDAVQASIAAAGGGMAAVTAGVEATYGTAANEAMVAAKANTADEDPVTKLKKLAEMRDAGLITNEEFEAKKTELLAKM